jgi:SagB-type dehydrogenase family enzyme
MPDPPAGEVLSGGRSPAGAPVGDLDELTMLLVTACSPTAVMRHAGGEHVFRSVPSAGALYPTEIYLACGKVQGLEDGLYHYEPIRGRLHRIRAQNLFPGTETTALRFFFSAVTFRSAWKYRARSYRYHLLDTGHAVEALVLALAALGRPATVGLEFDDDAVNRLLGLDTAREVALAWVDPARGKGVGPILDLPPLPDSLIRASRSSEAEVEYPELREIHERGKTVRHPVRGETASSMCRGLGLEPAPWSPLPAPGAWPAGHSFAETVHARRSSRNFVHEPMSREAFALLTAVLVARGEGADPHASVGIGLLVGGVEGTAPGFYLLDPEKGRHGSVRAGDYTSAMARISLDQAWAAGAALQVLFMADLGLLDRTRGARGYRHAMVAAGRLGHRVYLAATALGLGCCGIGAFYDREASELLGLAEDARLLYLLAVGPVQGGLRLRSR